MSAERPEGPPSPTAAELRRSVHEQLVRAERLIQSLTRDLDSERARGRALAGERDRLQLELATADARRVQLQEQKERLERTIVDLDRERRRLTEEGAHLRAELDAEREGAAQEIRCLEEQVQELTATVELLSGEGREAGPG